MNEEQKDKGLKKAVKEQPQFRLSSNFTFRTMQKVEEAALLRERKNERRTLYATIAASLFLIVSCVAYTFVFFGSAVKESFNQGMAQIGKSLAGFPVSCLLFIVIVPLLLFFDQWMRKQYFKRNL